MKNNSKFYYKFRFEYLDDFFSKGIFYSLQHSLSLSTPPTPTLLEEKLSLLCMWNSNKELYGVGRRLTKNIFHVHISPSEAKIMQKEKKKLSTKDKIADFFEEHPNEYYDAPQVADSIKSDSSYVRELLCSLHREGFLDKESHINEKRYRVYKYRLTPPLPDIDPSILSRKRNNG
tara:strand:+ start:3880 stop:4404 length:525 start_codon:yes stop_codon:yes gene_type:complete